MVTDLVVEGLWFLQKHELRLQVVVMFVVDEWFRLGLWLEAMCFSVGVEVLEAVALAELLLDVCDVGLSFLVVVVFSADVSVLLC